MEELTEVITAAECHPHQCNVFVYSSSKGTIRLCDMRAAALCDRHSKCKYFYRIVVKPSVCLENREFESAAISEINLSLTICLVFFVFSKMHLLPVNLISLSWSVIQLRANKIYTRIWGFPPLPFPFIFEVFEEPEDPSSRSFFSEIISSISDVKFSHSGRYMMTRDYLSVKVWDLNMENRPVETYQVLKHAFLGIQF